jgi:hypothetical protein
VNRYAHLGHCVLSIKDKPLSWVKTFKIGRFGYSGT